MFKTVYAFAFILFINNLAIFTQHVQATDNKAEKLLEIKELRQQISAALEKDEEKESNQRKGVVTQPEWTKFVLHSRANDEPKVSNSNALKEVELVRKEIADAVSKNKYAVGRHNESNLVAQADHFLGMKFRMKNLVSSVVAAAGERNEESSMDQIEFDDEDNSELNSNIIQSYNFQNDDFEAYHLIETKLNRRENDILKLKSIIENVNVKIDGTNITGWKIVKDNKKMILVGIKSNFLLLFDIENMRFTKRNFIKFNETIRYFDTVSIRTSNDEKGFVIIAINDAIQWYQVSNTKTPFYTVQFRDPVKCFQFFQIEDHQYIAVALEQSSNLLIYEIKLIQKELWIVQQISSKNATSKIIVLDTGRDIIMACIQNDIVLVYITKTKIDLNDHMHFQLFETYHSKDVKTITGFQMGGYTYIAFGGANPKIIRYNRGFFVTDTIFSHNFGYVSLFFPIPVRTYRDDLILLVQHQVEFESHNLTVLETLIWDGKEFLTSVPVPCLTDNKTFGFGVGCMLDERRIAGLEGSVLLENEGNMSIIVPRFEENSGIFEINTEFLLKNTETEDLQDIFDFLKDWMNEQEKVMNHSINLVNSIKTDPDVLALHTIEIDIFGKIDQIYVNNNKWTSLDTNLEFSDIINDLEHLQSEISELNCKDHSKRNKRQVRFSNMRMRNVIANELNVRNLNDNQVIIDNHGNLKFNGTVQLTNVVKVKKNIFSEFIENSNSINLNGLLCQGNVKFNQVNDIPWSHLISQIMMGNSALEIDHLEIKGEVRFDSQPYFHNLNKIEFPDNYLWANGLKSSIVKAEKRFLNTLSANHIDTVDSINGVFPFDIITLSASQNIPGLTTFSQLEVSERLEVNGTVRGKSLDTLLPNPSINHSKFIQSTCQFVTLHVIGMLKILDSVNDNKFDLMLNDVVFKTNSKEIAINSKKSFPNITVTNNSVLNLISNAINEIQLHKFVDKKSDQILQLQYVTGNIMFHYLNVQKLFNNIDIAELADNAIKINENQLTGSVVKFNNETNLKAQEVHVVEYLNNYAIRDFYTVYDNRLPLATAFRKISPFNLEVTDEIQGKGILNGNNVKSFKSKYLNYFRKPTHETVIYIDQLILGNELIVDNDSILNFFEQILNLSKMITAGKLNIERMIVYGSLNVNKLNRQPCNDLATNIIWLNRPNFIRTTVIFSEQIHVNSVLNLKNDLNKWNFSNWLANVVFRTNLRNEIFAQKRFTGSFRVNKTVEIEKINTIPFIRLANKQSSVHFNGQLEILGNLTTQQIDTKCCLNRYDVTNLQNFLQYNSSLKAFFVNGLTKIKVPANIENIYFKNSVNLIENFDDFIGDLVNKDNLCILKGKTIFENIVTFQKGAFIVKLNGFNVREFFNDIVLTNGSGVIQVKGPIVFTKILDAKNIEVENTLVTTNLMGFSLKEMIFNDLKLNRNTIFQGIVYFQAENIDGNEFIVSNLNGEPMSALWTLHSNQTFTEPQRFKKIYLNGSIKSLTGLLNGFDSFNEIKNTMLIMGNQHVTAPTTMQSLRVLRNLETHAEVNNKNLNNIATLFEDIVFQSPLSFINLTANAISTEDEITGIVFSEWQKNSLWSSGRSPQIIEGNWFFTDINVKLETTGNNRINNKQLQDLPFYNHSAEHRTIIQTECRQLCESTNQIIEKSRHFVYFLKFFEKSHQLQEAETINLFKFFEFNENNYIVSNVGCFSIIYAWNNTTFHYINKFKSGVIDQFLAIPTLDETAVHFVTTNNIYSQKLCNVQGGNVWKFQKSSVVFLRKFDESGNINFIHQSSAPPSESFFGLDDSSNIVTEFSIASNDEHNSWNISSDGKNVYHFLPRDAELGVALSDGKRIFVINQSKRRKLRQIPKDMQLLPYAKADRNYDLIPTADTNLTDWNTKWKFHISQILKDLVNNINDIINDTNVDSVDDVGEERTLCRDFLDILEELEKQNMFSDYKTLQLHKEYQNKSSLGELGEIYVIKTVKTLWTHLKDIEEISMSIDSKENSKIMNYFLNQIKGILSAADFQNQSWNTNKTNEIRKQIEQIRENVIVELQESCEESVFKLNEPLIGQPISERNLFIAENPYLPSRNTGEVLALKVGSHGNRRNLIVTIVPKDNLIDSNYQTVIHIYYDIIQGELYQSLPVRKPRSLTALHIGDETVLAYIEDKNIVRIFVFRGVQGFVEFSHFKSKHYITSITSAVRKSKQGCPQHFLVLNIESTVVFYKAIMNGKCSNFVKFDCSRL